MNKTLPSNIEGVLIQPLKRIVDERGSVMHMLRSDCSWFTKFGEIYFSAVNPGVVKAWKRHKKMTQHFAVPLAKIRLVLLDDRKTVNSKLLLEEFELGQPDKYCLFRIPPMIWYGFQGISECPALIANCTDMVHNPEETENKEISDKKFPYEWKNFGGEPL